MSQFLVRKKNIKKYFFKKASQETTTTTTKITYQQHVPVCFSHDRNLQVCSAFVRARSCTGPHPALSSRSPLSSPRGRGRSHSVTPRRTLPPSLNLHFLWVPVWVCMRVCAYRRYCTLHERRVARTHLISQRSDPLRDRCDLNHFVRWNIKQLQLEEVASGSTLR